jgi:ribosomal protein S1
MREQQRLTRPMWIRVKGEHHRGMLVEGVVSREIPGGYLVRLGRGRRLVFGFLSQSQLEQEARGAGATLATLAEGEILNAYVEDYDDSRMQILLSLRQAEPGEVVRFVESTALGTKLVGRVVDHGAAGVFVRLENGFDALLPKSEIPQVDQQPLEEILRLGDLVAGGFGASGWTCFRLLPGQRAQSLPSATRCRAI